MNLLHAKVHFLRFQCSEIDCMDQLMSFVAFRTLYDVSIMYGSVTHEDLRKILTGFDASRLEMKCKTEEGFSCDQAITVKDILCSQGSWLTGQMLLNLNCKEGSFWRSSLSDEDLNSFLKHWLEGSNTRMEYIILTPQRPSRVPPPAWNLSNIVEGIPTLPGAAKRREVMRHMYGGDVIPYENGLDMRRESDGMLATAVLYRDGSGNEVFLFTVWRVPDPNVVVVDE